MPTLLETDIYTKNQKGSHILCGKPNQNHFPTDDLSKYDTIKGGGKYTVIQKELTDRGETALANTHMTYVNAAIAEDWPSIVGARTAMYLT